MPKLNDTVFMPSVLTLIGIPGLEYVQFWIGIPFCAMYIIALFGNSLLLVIIKSESSLHEPMYLFLAMLGATDIVLSTCILPKMLEIFWFHLPEIYFVSCRCGSFITSSVLSQVFCWPWPWTTMWQSVILWDMQAFLLTNFSHRLVLEWHSEQPSLWFHVSSSSNTSWNITEPLWLPILIVSTWPSWSWQQKIFELTRFMVCLWLSVYLALT